MSDLVERLKDVAPAYSLGHLAVLIREGIAEIKRLRAENVGLRAEVEWLNERIDKLAPR